MEDGWVDLSQLTGWSAYRLPTALRDQDVTDTRIESLMGVFGGDLWLNPSSGGVFGQGNIAHAVGLSLRQAERTVLQEPFIRRAHGVAASNVASLTAWREGHGARVRETHRDALHRTSTDPSPGMTMPELCPRPKNPPSFPPIASQDEKANPPETFAFPRGCKPNLRL